MSIKVENINGILSVIIPPEYKKPWWADCMYSGKYKEKEDGSLIFPCRDCNVTITKPVVQKTPMGMMQTTQTFVEKWVYFDVPQLSILVTEGTDLLEHWSLEELQIDMKEELTKPEEVHNEETLGDKTDGV